MRVDRSYAGSRDNIARLHKRWRVRILPERECRTGQRFGFQLQPQRRERGHTPAGAESVPRTLGPKRAHRVRQDRREYRQAPEAGPSGRAAHDRREFLPDQESSRLREGRTRGDTRRLQEMAMTTSDEAVYAVGQQGQQALDVQEDYWALLAEAPQD